MSGKFHEDESVASTLQVCSRPKKATWSCWQIILVSSLAEVSWSPVVSLHSRFSWTPAFANLPCSLMLASAYVTAPADARFCLSDPLPVTAVRNPICTICDEKREENTNNQVNRLFIG